MPTVRSRCARIRLGPVAVRDIESILEGADLADAPLAARLARLSGGRPGLARSLALAPDAIAARDEIARTLLHLIGAGPSDRLASARGLLDRATELDRALERATLESAAAAGEGSGAGGATRGGRGGSRRSTRAGAGRSPAGAEPTEPVADDATETVDAEATAGPAVSASAAQRRKAAATIVGLWRELARDLVVARLGVEREVRDPGLLDDLRDAAATLGGTANEAGPGGPPTLTSGGASGPDPVAAALTGFLVRLDAAGELLEANARPELVMDTLLLAWPFAAVLGPSR